MDTNENPAPQSRRIHSLVVENFKRVEAISVAFNNRGELVEFAGQNGSGKSSTLDSIECALAGARCEPDRPIRDGSRAAQVVVDLGDLVVKRRWTKGRRSLVVTDREGCELRSPQTILDRFCEKFSFDPIKFLGLESKAQAEALRRLAGLDFADLDQREEAARVERTEVNRALKGLEGRLGAMGRGAAEPVEGVDTRELTEKLGVAQKYQVDIYQANKDLVGHQMAIATSEVRIKSLEEQIRREMAASDQHKIDAKAVQRRLAFFERQAPDISSIASAIDSASATNARAREHQEWLALAEQIDNTKHHVELLNEDISAAQLERSDRLATAKFPVAGLGLEGDTVTLGGVPMAQASSAQRIVACLAISAALNPGLRVVLVREGSLLDRTMLATVAKWAEENDYQVLMERVDDQVKGTGVVISDGRVVESTGLPGADGERERETVGDTHYTPHPIPASPPTGRPKSPAKASKAEVIEAEDEDDLLPPLKMKVPMLATPVKIQPEAQPVPCTKKAVSRYPGAPIEIVDIKNTHELDSDILLASVVDRLEEITSASEYRWPGPADGIVDPDRFRRASEGKAGEMAAEAKVDGENSRMGRLGRMAPAGYSFKLDVDGDGEGDRDGDGDGPSKQAQTQAQPPSGVSVIKPATANDWDDI